MDNGSQTKRPLEDKAEESSEKVQKAQKQEVVQTPPEQALGRDADEEASGADKTTVPDELQQQKQSNEAEQSTPAVQPTPKEKVEPSSGQVSARETTTSRPGGVDKQSKPWHGFSFKSFSFGFGGARDTKNKEYWQNMSLDVKRTHYKCGKNYLTLSDIPSWPELHQTFSEKKHELSSVDDQQYSVNTALNNKISLWRGDITKLEIDAIVNAANHSLMGGGGVDGAIHSAASTSLRDECAELNGCDTGDTKLTTGHRLPAKYILHTVGPINGSSEKLTSCYKTCLELVLEHNIRSVAFCCVATGVYGFPNEEACQIALKTTREWLETGNNAEKVDRIIFTVFLQIDYQLYKKWLHHYYPLEETEATKDSTPPPQETMETTPPPDDTNMPILEKSMTAPAKTVVMETNDQTEMAEAKDGGKEGDREEMEAKDGGKEGDREEMEAKDGGKEGDGEETEAENMDKAVDESTKKLE